MNKAAYTTILITFCTCLRGHASPVDSTTRADSVRTLREVVVTARESRGPVTASRIGRDAMRHLQPTSFTDLLELLPGKMSQNPNTASANLITLRETGTVGATGSSYQDSRYAASSLGTLFVVDGAPIVTDAAIQTVGSGSDTQSEQRNTTNRGVDMRTISTDNIESVEIVRGIPSAEYGNLTSGMVNITRTSRKSPLTARFKADGYSRLFSIGKGTAMGRTVLNADAAWLDARTDPRNSLENYQRLTASARVRSAFSAAGWRILYNAGADISASIDREKVDPDLNMGAVDSYSSHYVRTAFTGQLKARSMKPRFFNQLVINVSASVQSDRLSRSRTVAPLRTALAPSTLTDGVSDANFLIGEYVAQYQNLGMPVSLYAKASAAGSDHNGAWRHSYKAGVEWWLTKNLGEGEVYDLARPLSSVWSTRPYRYSSIPALHTLGAYAEDNIKVTFGPMSANLLAGVRVTTLPSLPSERYLAWRPYVDPRLNLTVSMPTVNLAGRPFTATVGGGWGLTSKMPTLDMLYPRTDYTTLVQLMYYDTANPLTNSRANVRTYANNTVNNALRAARNAKREVRAALQWGQLALDVTAFNETMRSGFRSMAVYQPYTFTRYDASAINGATLSGGPSLEGLPSMETTVLRGFSRTENGSRIDKRGIEWQLTTPRWRQLGTSLTVSGAWLNTVYSSYGQFYKTVSHVVGNQTIADRYVGVYAYNDGRRNNQVNTNFMTDTQIAPLGLIFTASLQCMWLTNTTLLPMDPVPTMYLDATDGQLHPYTTEAVAQNPLLRYLELSYNPASYSTVTVPLAMYLNLKATKRVGQWLNVAMFVNRLFHWLPAYSNNGLTVRRTSNPYFGMEINLTI